VLTRLPGYGVNFEHSRFACSRTSAATPASSTARNTVPMSDAISRIWSGPMPAVVHDAEPSRSPLVTNGFSGSFGIAFLLHVIPARSSALLGDLARHAERPEVDEHQMVVGTTRHDAKTLFRQGRGECLRVGDDVGRVLAEGGLARLAERDGLGRDDVHQRAALQAGEHRLVDAGRVFVARKDRTGAGPRAASCGW